MSRFCSVDVAACWGGRTTASLGGRCLVDLCGKPEPAPEQNGYVRLAKEAGLIKSNKQSALRQQVDRQEDVRVEEEGETNEENEENIENNESVEV